MTPDLLARIAIAALLVPLLAATRPVSRTWTFESDPVGAAPAGFTLAKTGGGAPGRWIVQREHDAPSGRSVLAQLDPDETDSRFPLAVAAEPSLRDLRLSVKCKVVSGRIDQACGLVFRYGDPENYYVARANALEDNVRLYAVKGGRRRQLGSWSGSVSAGQWYELRVKARGKRIEVFWEGKAIIGADDRTFREAGGVGLWTKADSRTLFDDLTVEAL